MTPDGRQLSGYDDAKWSLADVLDSPLSHSDAQLLTRRLPPPLSALVPVRTPI